MDEIALRAVGSRSQAACVALVVLMVSCQARADSPDSHSQPPAFQPARVCGACHAKAYAEWKASWMSRAYSNPIFQRDYETMRELEKSDPRASSRECLRCHAPMALILGDDEVQQELSQEGVTCDFCHSVARIRDEPGRKVVVIDPRGIKYTAGSPKASPSAHPVMQGPLSDARLCGACHLDFASNGIPLERTYQEWAEGPYAGNLTCVDCHMRSPQAARTGPEAKALGMRSHRFEGGHSGSSLLPGAARLRLLPREASGALRLEVHNALVGHHFPTAGAHPNELVLEVRIEDEAGVSLFDARRVYRFSYLDSQGRPVSGAEAVVVSVSDTTLAPQERRIESFAVQGLKQAARLKARLVYSLVPSEFRELLGNSLYEAEYRSVEIHSLDEAL